MTANMTATAGLKYYAMPTFQTPPNYAFMANALQIYILLMFSIVMQMYCIKMQIWARKIKATINLVYNLLTTNTACTQNFKIKI